ncbi:MAG: TetR/AcrR family transcriptional regulator [Methylocystis sp.]|uniref:TetR/AcrR family transcriptional regulator n=1 Tax=Methylocystis sp. TaxID=1911079 RepID=UPI003D13A2BF
MTARKDSGASSLTAAAAQPALAGRSTECSSPETLAEAHVAGRKECSVIAAARKLFLEQGFVETSMDAIARSACVSKATLYAYFPSKEALFAHLIEAECRLKASRLQMPDLDIGLVEALRSFARQFVEVYMTPESMAFFQAISSERSRFPQLCQLFFDSGPKNELLRVAALLEEAKARGLLTFSDATEAAGHFLSLIRGDLPLHTALGLEPRDEASVAAMVDAGIGAFLRAYRVEGTPCVGAKRHKRIASN